MSWLRSALLVPVLILGLHAGEGAAPGAPEAVPTDPAKLRQEASYQLGVMLMAEQMKPIVDGFGLDPAQVLAGMQDAAAGKATALPPQRIEQLMQAQRTAASATLKTSNAAWLAENGKKPGIVTTASGLQYEVITAGPKTSAKPVMGSSVQCHYKGTLISGKEFDASLRHGPAPATFEVGQVIQGWNEALQLMQEGDKWRLFIPSDLAYGENGPPAIGPNQVLIFEVELVKVVGGGAGGATIKLAP